MLGVPVIKLFRVLQKVLFISLQGGIVQCTQMTCPSTEGCYVILFDNFQEDRKCCDVCKGTFMSFLCVRPAGKQH